MQYIKSDTNIMDLTLYRNEHSSCKAPATLEPEARGTWSPRPGPEIL